MGSGLAPSSSHRTGSISSLGSNGGTCLNNVSIHMRKQYSVWLLISSFNLLMHPYLMKCNVHVLITSLYLVNASD